jgi:hypothetical protein
MVVSVLVWVERFARRAFCPHSLLASPVPDGGQEFVTIDCARQWETLAG